MQVTSEAQVKAALDLAQQQFGDEVSVAVSCAGLGYARRTLSSKRTPHDLEGFAKIVHVNAVGTFNVLRLAAQRSVPMPTSGIAMSHGRSFFVKSSEIFSLYSRCNFLKRQPRLLTCQTLAS
jgi:NAD(P)-dependent dehydrogenase (short-subunit alcohol dehydrogenase family)